MLLHRGHGSILSGFFIVFSSEVLISLCSVLLEVFKDEVSCSTDGDLWFLLLTADVEGSLKCSSILSK